MIYKHAENQGIGIVKVAFSSHLRYKETPVDNNRRSFFIFVNNTHYNYL